MTRLEAPPLSPPHPQAARVETSSGLKLAPTAAVPQYAVPLPERLSDGDFNVYRCGASPFAIHPSSSDLNSTQQRPPSPPSTTQERGVPHAADDGVPRALRGRQDPARHVGEHLLAPRRPPQLRLAGPRTVHQPPFHLTQLKPAGTAVVRHSRDSQLSLS